MIQRINKALAESTCKPATLSSEYLKQNEDVQQKVEEAVARGVSVLPKAVAVEEDIKFKWYSFQPSNSQLGARKASRAERFLFR